MQCPACGKSYAVEEKRAGRRMTCKYCSEEILVAISEVAPKLRVECERCGKGHWVSAEHAGKKTVCKQCGAMFRIVIGGTAPAGSPSERDAEADVPAPVDLDVYGLNEEPIAPGNGGAAGSEESGRTGSGREDSCRCLRGSSPTSPFRKRRRRRSPSGRTRSRRRRSATQPSESRSERCWRSP